MDITLKRIGILGGGQLGLMLLQSSMSLGLEVSVLDPNHEASVHTFSSNFVLGSFKDEETVFEFGKNLDVLTLEIEHVNINALKRLEKLGIKVFPQSHIISLIQDKGLQKNFLKKHQIPSAPFCFVDEKSKMEDISPFLPGMLKLRKGGYDGKGVQKVKDWEELQEIIKFSPFNTPCILESWAHFEKEISVIVARNENGEIVSYDPVEMEFNSQSNLVEFLIAPARISVDCSKKAKNLAENILQKLEMVGLLAVEMFLFKDDNLWVNELAPRPHNSGHHTIEACYTSQFEQHLRAILNWPLGSTATRVPSVMINLLGDQKFKGSVIYKGLEAVFKQEGSFLHLYNKKQTSPMRKMGHITLVHMNIEHAYLKAKELKEKVSVVAR